MNDTAKQIQQQPNKELCGDELKADNKLRQSTYKKIVRFLKRRHYGGCLALLEEEKSKLSRRNMEDIHCELTRPSHPSGPGEQQNSIIVVRDILSSL